MRLVGEAGGHKLSRLMGRVKRDIPATASTTRGPVVVGRGSCCSGLGAADCQRSRLERTFRQAPALLTVGSPDVDAAWCLPGVARTE